MPKSRLINRNHPNLVLSVNQFQRFMGVISKLGERVEKEHNQFLRDSQRIEDRSTTADNSSTGAPQQGGAVDFESLVGGANGASVKADTVIDSNKSWDDDVWGSIFASGPEVNNAQTGSTRVSDSMIGSKPSDAPCIDLIEAAGSIFAIFAKIYDFKSYGSPFKARREAIILFVIQQLDILNLAPT